MKVALVTRRYPPEIGGAEKMLSYLAPALAKIGADVTVVTSAILDPAKAAKSAEVDASSPVPIARLYTSRLRYIGTTLYMQMLKYWLLTHRPDVIYVSMLKHDAFMAVEVAKRLGVPVLLRPEGAGATGDLAWHAWGRFGASIGERCKRADAFVAISPAVRAELIDAGYDPAKIHDLANGVPVPAEPWVDRPIHESMVINPDDAPASRHPFLPRRLLNAAYVGRLAPEKGLDVLIDAWAIVRRRMSNAHLHLIGEGPMRPALEAQIGGLSLRSSVVLYGACPAPSNMLRHMNLFVLPSHEEGMSIALLEAMALGIPVVATDIPGNRGLITDLVHGRLVPPEDPQALAEAILTRWNPEWYGDQRSVHMANLARQRVIDEFSIEAVARRHLELFERLLLAKNPTS